MSDSIVNVAETFGLTNDQSMSGTSPLVRRHLSPARQKALVECATMWKRTFDGDPRAALSVREALSTSDLFVSTTGDVLDRELLAQYAGITPEWASFADSTTVRNFKPKKLVDFMGGRSVLDGVPELTEYPAAEGPSNAEYQISVAKFGRRFGFSWESLINDDLDELQRIPSLFAQSASLTEDKAARDLIATSTGAPNTNFFKSANGNAKVSKALTADNLRAGIQAVQTRKDSDGLIVAPTNGLILVVGPAQEFTARQILTASEVRVEDTTTNTTTIHANDLAGAITLVVLKRLPGSAWFILPKPGGARPALAVAHLRGWETPDLRVKADTGQRTGGGAIGATDGSFDDDSIYYRVRHVVGAATVDPIHTYASDGGS